MDDKRPKGRLTEAQANAIFHIAEDAIISIDSAQRIILFNGGAEKVFGYKADEVIGQPLDLLIPPASRENHGSLVDKFGLQEINARRMGERGEIQGLHKNGSLVPMEASICAVEEDGEKVYTAILRDISERKAAQAILQQAKDQAEAADYAKSIFLANMSHEIRTPLNAIVGMTSLVLDTQLTTEQKDCVETIHSSSESLLSIVNDILDYSKIEVGKLDLESYPFDLRNCIEESLDQVSSTAANKQINLAYMLDDGVPAVVVADGSRLQQILVNLLSNATKFTHRGEVLVNVSARQTAPDLYRVQFEVSDTGIGIPRDRMDSLFESFSQLDASTTRKYGGTGLGLAISRRLVNLMGGDITVETEPGEGSTFSFSIVASAGGEDLAHSFLQDDALELRGKRLLIVDDHRTNRRILVKQALLWGMQPTATASGVEAMDLIRHGDAFDIAILDMSMPEMDGLELARQIRSYRSPAQLPIIMLSSISHRPQMHKREQEKIRLAAFLSKPIKAGQLFNVLKSSLGIDLSHTGVEDTHGFDASMARRHPMHILIAEDNLINQKVVQQLLRKFGYQADVVANGKEVLSALADRDYDLILMDLHMPEMDGLEACQRIQRQIPADRRPRIVAMTANVMPAHRNACEEAGMTGFLSKPVRLQQLRDILAGRATSTPSLAGLQEPESTEIDMQRLEMIRQADNSEDEALLGSVIDIFLEEAEQRIASMRESCVNQDWTTLENEAHRFFTSCSNLGLVRMSSLCAQLEAQAMLNGVDKSILINQLTRAYEKVRPELERQKLASGI